MGGVLDISVGRLIMLRGFAQLVWFFEGWEEAEG
jgi:hypothetical protein